MFKFYFDINYFIFGLQSCPFNLALLTHPPSVATVMSCHGHEVVFFFFVRFIVVLWNFFLMVEWFIWSSHFYNCKFKKGPAITFGASYSFRLLSFNLQLLLFLHAALTITMYSIQHDLSLWKTLGTNSSFHKHNTNGRGIMSY